MPPKPPLRLLAGRTLSARRFSAAAAARRPAPGPVRLTASSYPALRRDPRFAALTAADIDHFRAICPLTSDAADTDAFNTDWMGKYRGQSQLVLKPRSTADVSAILKHCHSRRLAVVPQGGNTGLVGGGVPVFDEIILSLSSLNRIRSFDAVSGVLVADAGVVLEAADSYLSERGHIFPLDLGAKGSCQLGGNVSTNAGGLRLLRYGSLHGSVLGVEAVLADGTVLDDLYTLRKNNTGHDLKQLFIGSEGTLGVVTAVSVHCPPRPAATNVALFALPTYAAVQTAFVAAKKMLSEILSAFEMMDGTSQRLVAAVTGRSHPLADAGTDSPFYVLVETSGSNTDHDAAKLEAFLATVMDDGTVTDGVLAQDETQRRTLWSWREGVPECMGHWGGVYKYDVSIPLPELYALVEDVRARMVDRGLLLLPGGGADGGVVVDVTGFGHIGDSNLHLNIPVRRYDAAVEEALEPYVYEWIQKRRGSISAEHGLGLAKRAFVGYSRGVTELAVMRGLKGLFDQRGILNPYKYIGVD